MAFFTLPFLIFISIVTIIYFIVPLKYRWIVLLAASYTYFWFNSHKLVLVLFAQTAVTFLIGRWIEKVLNSGKLVIQNSEKELTSAERKAIKLEYKGRAKKVLILGVVLILGTLLFLKYYNFFAENINILLSKAGTALPMHHLLLPIGISFYSLQALAYIIDIYRGKINADRCLPKFMLFMSFFPQIVQGPIPRYSQLAEQLYEGHKFDYYRFTKGIQLIMWGFFKKLVIAERIGIPAAYIFDNSAQFSGGMTFLGAVFYGLQVYTDFSGGMDIARGISQIFGIELELNFTQPYFSVSVEDFWRRWHRTLGAFMRDYVFYPLSLSKPFVQMSKKSRKIFGDFVGKRLPAFFSMFIVYLLVGFWHGPEWKFTIFGLWNGFFIMSSILLEGVYDKAKQALHIDGESVSWKIFMCVRTFFIYSFGRFLSRAANVPTALHMMRSVFHHWWDFSFLVDGRMLTLGIDTANWAVLAIAIILLFVVDLLHEREVQIRESIAKQHIIFRWIVFYAALFIILIFGVWGPEYDSAGFIYEQF